MFNEFLENCFDNAIRLKERFKITEKKEWNTLIVILELNVQIGHYTSLLSSNKYAIENGRKINNKADELSDILLQLCTLCWKLKIKKQDITLEEYDFNDEFYAILDLQTLLGQVSEVLLEDTQYRHYKPRYGFKNHIAFLLEKISKMFSIVIKICEINKFNVVDEFNVMCKDANNFLDSYVRSE